MTSANNVHSRLHFAIAVAQQSVSSLLIGQNIAQTEMYTQSTIPQLRNLALVQEHTPSVCHCHSTHTCIWIWPSDGLLGYFSNKQAEVTPGNLIARSRQKSTRSRHKPPVLGKKHPFSEKSTRSQYNPPVIRTLFSQSRLMWPRKNKLLSK